MYRVVYLCSEIRQDCVQILLAEYTFDGHTQIVRKPHNLLYEIEFIIAYTCQTSRRNKTQTSL